MKFARLQNGMSLTSWLVVLAVVGFLASAAIKLIPHYMDNSAIDNIITQVETDHTLNIRTLADLRTHIYKGLEVNTITLDKDDIVTQIDGNTFVIKVKYDKREPLIKNIDLVVNFDKEYRVRMP